MDATADQANNDRGRAPRWPREVVVEHDDGTVSLLADVSVTAGTVRARRAGDRFREDN
jgi:hypothetical protein